MRQLPEEDLTLLCCPDRRLLSPDNSPQAETNPKALKNKNKIPLSRSYPPEQKKSEQSVPAPVTIPTSRHQLQQEG